MYRIFCKVSGGVTGTRTAYYKDNGIEQTFLEKESAQAVCDTLNRTANSNPYQKATFRYTPEKFL